MQKVVEGERAQRSEVQRKLREVERTLAAIKNPDWWPGVVPRWAHAAGLGATIAGVCRQTGWLAASPLSHWLAHGRCVQCMQDMLNG